MSMFIMDPIKAAVEYYMSIEDINHQDKKLANNQETYPLKKIGQVEEAKKKLVKTLHSPKTYSSKKNERVGNTTRKLVKVFRNNRIKH